MKTYKTNNQTFTITQRTGDVCMATANGKYHEVFIMRHLKDVTIRERLVPAHEAIPKPSQWGRQAWSFTGEAKAQEKYDSLIASEVDVESVLTSTHTQLYI